MKKLFLFIVLVLVLALVLVSVILFFTTKNSRPVVVVDSLEIVVARYNEKLQWLRDAPFNKYPVIVYNKGPNENFEKTSMIQRVVPLPDVGREGHTYLYHIIQNYDSLADITCFFPGSTDTEHKMEKATAIFKEIETKHKKTVLACHYKMDNISKELYSFELDKYHATNEDNNIANNNYNIEPSKIRPFGKWFKHHFGDTVITCAVGGMVFSVSREDILKKPKAHYEKLLKEVDSHSNPETGHYFERSIEAIFYPITKDKMVNLG